MRPFLAQAGERAAATASSVRMGVVGVAIAVVAVVAVIALSAGCDRDEPGGPPPRPAPAAPVASVARALGVDAAEIEPLVDPPPATGDLKSEIDAFTTVDACVEQHGHVDPLLGDALEAIGYDTFVRDACRTLDAAKARDAKRCEPIDASSLRRRCEATVAAVAGDPDTCPWLVSGKPALGRDGCCLSIALRDPRLCAAGETTAARATCEATVLHDPAACSKLALHSDQIRCRRDAERWRSATPPPDAGAAAMPADGTLHVDGIDGGAASDVSLAGDLARGIVLVEQRDGARFGIGAISETGPGFLAASPHVQATFAVDLFASADGRVVTVERVDLLLPGRAPLGTPLARSTIAAKIDKLEHVRGGAVALSLDGDLGDSTGTVHVHATVKTFVRDVVSAKAIYGAGVGGGGLGGAMGGGLRGFGDAGPMR